MNKLRPTKCVYCGSSAKSTRDHVPPKLLFAPPLPNLCTVPSCSDCNKSFQKDDEYLRLILTMRKESFDNLGAKAVLPSVLRSLQRPRQARFTSSFFRQCGQIEMRSRGGLYLGNSPGYTVKWSRIERAMARITRGLFYYEQKKPIPKGHQVVSWAEDNLYLLSNNLQTQLKQKLVLPLIKETPTVFGESVFRYWFKFLSETESNSVWLFEFYGRTRFIAFVADRDPNRLLERLGDKLNPSTDKEKPTPA